MTTAQPKPFGDITKGMVWEAYKKVKANGGAGGVDELGLKEFDSNAGRNLYKVWNRMASGSYFPPEVKAVPIPKKSGGERILGIPTIGDRVAQMVVKNRIEPELDKIFHKDSYGYRPNKSALQAIGEARKRCWEYAWVLEFDIKGLFDNIDHDLLMKAVNHHVKEKWILLYIERWIKAPMNKQGEITPRDKGTPQGGVVSPLLSNLFLHYAFDRWMGANHSDCPFVRYADDAVIHCHSKEKALQMKSDLEARLNGLGLELHSQKTRVVYCYQGAREKRKENVTFDFLGYTFKPRTVRRNGKLLTGFLPAVSGKAKKAINQKIRKWGVRLRSDKKIKEIAEFCNPAIRGWINYYGRFYGSGLQCTLRRMNNALVNWARRTIKKLKKSYRRAYRWLKKFAESNRALFVHWNKVPP